MAKCDAPGCTKTKHYAAARGLPPQYCGAHAPLNWPNVVAKPCEEVGCLKVATFARLGEPASRASRCASHALPGWIDVVSKQCGVGGCTVRPHFGLPGGKATRCVTHADVGMLNLLNKRCGVDGCVKKPSFNLPGEKPLRCAPHASPGMVDVVNRRCEVAGCGKVNPSYGPPGGPKRFCAVHARDDDVLLTVRRPKGAPRVRRGRPPPPPPPELEPQEDGLLV